jgi:hypothetical protein
MAWTAPITFVPETVLTAAQLNLHIRNNLNEMAPAKASAPGNIFVTTGRNQIREQTPVFDFYEGLYNSDTEKTTSAEYTDLKHVGPSVTTFVSYGALVSLSVRSNNTSANAFCITSFEVTKSAVGDELNSEVVHEATDERSLLFETAVGGTDGQDMATGYTTLIGVPEPAEYSFRLKFRVTAGTGTFYRRWLSVIPF